MKIAWCKVSLPMEIDYWMSTTNTGADDRAGFMEHFVKNGHTINLYTFLKPHDEKLFTNRKKELRNRPYMSWTKALKYMPTKFPKEDDVLIVECGADTMNFRDKYTGLPCIRRFVEIVDSFEGPVFYLHMDPTQPFQFKQFVAKKYPWGSKMNGYTNPIKGETTGVKNWVMHSQWATKEEMFDNKTTVLVAKTKKLKLLQRLFNRGIDTYAGRTGYGQLKEYINFESIPPAHDPKWFEYKAFRSRGKGVLIPQGVIYTGGDRGRRAGFRRLCSGTKTGVLATGIWKDKVFNETLDNVSFTGWLNSRQGILNLINKSLCGIQITTSHGEKLGWLTAKTFETIYARSILLMDKNIYEGEKYVIDPYFLVKDSKDVDKKVKELRQLSKGERESIHDQQIELALTYNWGVVVSKMESLFKKYL